MYKYIYSSASGCNSHFVFLQVDSHDTEIILDIAVWVASLQSLYLLMINCKIWLRPVREKTDDVVTCINQYTLLKGHPKLPSPKHAFDHVLCSHLQYAATNTPSLQWLLNIGLTVYSFIDYECQYFSHQQDPSII